MKRQQNVYLPTLSKMVAALFLKAKKGWGCRSCPKVMKCFIQMQ